MADSKPVAVVAGGELGFFFFFNDTATTEIYTLSLHDALPIFREVDQRRRRDRRQRIVGRHERHAPRPVGVVVVLGRVVQRNDRRPDVLRDRDRLLDRKSTRLNSSHLVISYAVFCLKKKKTPHPLAPVSAADYRADFGRAFRAYTLGHEASWQ